VGSITQSMNPSEFVKMASDASLHLAYALGRGAFEKYPDAEGVYIGGGSWLTLPVIGRLEAEFGKPVLTHQVATVWHVLTLLDCWVPIQGFGRLLQTS
jgi:maleate cis-trans isomerase